MNAPAYALSIIPIVNLQNISMDVLTLHIILLYSHVSVIDLEKFVYVVCYFIVTLIVWKDFYWFDV